MKLTVSAPRAQGGSLPRGGGSGWAGHSRAGHSHATLLLVNGEDAKVVSERLGHASVTLTLDSYSHVLPGMPDLATERLDALLMGAKQVVHAFLGATSGGGPDLVVIGRIRVVGCRDCEVSLHSDPGDAANRR